MANFRYFEKITTSQDLLDDIKSMLTDAKFATYPHNAAAGEQPVNNTWSVVSEVPDATSKRIKELVLKSTATIGTATKEYYVKFINPGFDPANTRKHSTLTVQMMEGYDTTNQKYAHIGHPVVYEWADQEYKDGANFTDRTLTKPVYMYANIMNNRLALVLVGDPAVHFVDYRKSFLYVGAIQPFKYNQDDVGGNILLTAGAVTPEVTQPIKDFNAGQYTSFGNNTFQMFATKSGIKFQRHYPSFITQVPTVGKAYTDPKLGDTGLLLEPQGFNASAWTRKYHLSPIYIIHPYDGYRGQLDYVIAVSKNNILHLDELIVDVDANSGKKWKQEVYRYFDHNTEQNFMNRSANVKMGIAFLKEVRY
ncbi:hypothetical protein NQ117_09515 [Paenibacillus sp. SC116]|uniref:hypothetical protein n=1 Tax=Paenibacillus sp. SC116 TaxID=2968986 RepID=UPI00215B2027|nr:hypothetical protein [Paenibacillus sp. SC116]MCR8843925.1 hypothetical protein [Paenibacillus sp. SC116]